jgi:thioredoxin 1
MISIRRGLSFIAVAMSGFCFAGCDNPAAINESTANVKHVSQGDFAAEVTLCSQPVVVDFYATWCGPCRVLSPMLDRAAGGYTGKIKFVKVNVDESPGLAQNYHADAIPMVLMFKDGKLADKIVGVPAETDLKAKLDALAAGKISGTLTNPPVQ